MLTDAQKRTRNKWDAENMSVISCKLRRDVAERFKDAARAAETTPNELIRGWISNFLDSKQPEV